MPSTGSDTIWIGPAALVVVIDSVVMVGVNTPWEYLARSVKDWPSTIGPG
jgi:hypothetical protein